MSSAAEDLRYPDLSHADQRVTLREVSWRAYQSFLASRGDSAGMRVTYLEGELELMTPSIDHDTQKKYVARLVEAWAEEAGVTLEGAGSWTVKNRSARRGAEADECYFVGATRAPAPDIAIEVVWTHGGIDKLEVWRLLGAREVWFCERGRLSFHVLDGERYAEAARSALLPTLDPSLIERCMKEATQTAAVRKLRAEMKKKAAVRKGRGRK